MNNPPANESGKPPVIGVVGAVCSGKSTVARMMAREGFEHIDADALAHEVLNRPGTKRTLKDAFGETIFREDGSVDREALSRIVFAGPEELRKLNRIVHPPVLEEIKERVQRATGPVVLDAALLLETHLHRQCCDLLVYVDTPEHLRKRRAEKERGWESEELHRRESAQLPLEEKKAKADLTIRNDRTEEKLRQNVKELIEQIRQIFTEFSVPCPNDS
jgi:dephospho-CoA kinase